MSLSSLTVEINPNIKVTYHNARRSTFICTDSFRTDILVDKDSIIQQVNVNKITYLKLNAVISIRNKPFKIRKILLNTSNKITGFYSFDLLFEEINFTSILMSPLLIIGDKVTTQKKDWLWDTHLVNFYSNWEGSSVDHTLFAYYRFDGSRDIVKLEEWFLNHQYFQARHDIDSCHVLYEFTLPEEVREEFKKFKEGKYSYFSSDYISKCIAFHSWTPDRHWYKVLKRDETLRKELENKYEVKIPSFIDLESRPRLDTIECFNSDLIITK